MVNDLRKNKLLGKEKKQVIKMLGENYGNRKDNDRNGISYNTHDPEGAFSIDHFELVVWFDNYDRVSYVTYQMF